MEEMINKAKKLYKTSKDKGYKVYKNHVAFWGSELSNFYPCKFELDGHVWKSSEQYFMAKKAEFFKDNEAFNKILNTELASEAKKIGREVKNYNDEQWSEVREEIMYDGVYAKFSQNQNLLNFLFSQEFDNKKFVEGNPFDKIWGVGLNYNNTDIDNELNWNGQNLLGKILDNIKTDISLKGVFDSIA